MRYSGQLLERLRHMTRVSAYLGLATAVAVVPSSDLGLFAPAIAVFIFTAVRWAIIRHAERGTESLWQRFSESSAKDPRYSALLARLRTFCAASPVELVISRRELLTAVTHQRGNTALVEIPVVYLRQHAPLGRPARAWQVGDPFPPSIDGMLAHEAGHVVVSDPHRFVPLLAEVAAAIAVSVWVAVCILQFDASAPAFTALQPLAIGALVLVGWSASVRGRELAADAFAAQVVGTDVVKAALSAQLVSNSAKANGRNSIVRLFAHPELPWRVRLPGMDENLGWRSLLMIGVATGAAFRGQHFATAQVATASGAPWPIFRAVQLVTFFWIVWLLYDIFWFKNASRGPPAIRSVARSLGQVVALALTFATTRWLISSEVDHWPFLVGLALVLVAWASANAALAFMQGASPSPLLTVACICCSAGVAAVTAVALGGLLWALADWAPSLLEFLIGSAPDESRMSGLFLSLVALSLLTLGLGTHLIAHRRYKGEPA